jgi:hypothetical protein
VVGGRWWCRRTRERKSDLVKRKSTVPWESFEQSRMLTRQRVNVSTFEGSTVSSPRGLCGTFVVIEYGFFLFFLYLSTNVIFFSSPCPGLHHHCRLKILPHPHVAWKPFGVPSQIQFLSLTGNLTVFFSFCAYIISLFDGSIADLTGPMMPPLPPHLAWPQRHRPERLLTGWIPTAAPTTTRTTTATMRRPRPRPRDDDDAMTATTMTRRPQRRGRDDRGHDQTATTMTRRLRRRSAF